MKLFLLSVVMLLSFSINTNAASIKMVDAPQNEVQIVAKRDTNPVVDKWFNDLKKEMNISDFYRWNVAILDLGNAIEEKLDRNMYGGTGQIRAISPEQENIVDNMSVVIGIRIHYVKEHEDEVKKIVRSCLKNYDHAAGRVVIRYRPSKYSLVELTNIKNEIEKDMKRNPNLRKAVFMIIISDARIWLYEHDEYDEAEKYLKTFKYSDAVRIMTNIGINPST